MVAVVAAILQSVWSGLLNGCSLKQPLNISGQTLHTFESSAANKDS
jgi:hypothetical protein